MVTEGVRVGPAIVTPILDATELAKAASTAGADAVKAAAEAAGAGAEVQAS